MPSDKENIRLYIDQLRKFLRRVEWNKSDIGSATLIETIVTNDKNAWKIPHGISFPTPADYTMARQDAIREKRPIEKILIEEYGVSQEALDWEESVTKLSYIRWTIPLYIFAKEDIFPDMEQCGFAFLVIKYPCYPLPKHILKDQDSLRNVIRKMLSELSLYDKEPHYSGKLSFLVVCVYPDSHHKVVSSSLFSRRERLRPPSSTLLKKLCKSAYKNYFTDLFQTSTS